MMAAAAEANPEHVDQLFRNIQGTLNNIVIPFLLVVATLIFIFAILRYLFSAGEKQAEMRGLILWTIIALAAILSLWALVNLLSGYFGTGKIPTDTIYK